MSFASQVLAQAPYLWLRLNETNGTVAVDSSGNKRNGSYIGAVTLNQPGFTNDGNTSVLTSANGAVQLPSGAGLTNAAFSLGFYWQPTSLITNSYIAGTGVSGQASGWSLRQTGTGLALYVNNASVATATNANAGIAAGSPTLVWVTYDGAGNWTVEVGDSPTPCMTATGANLTAPTGSPVAQVGTFAGQTPEAVGYFQDIMLFTSVVTAANRAKVSTASVGGVTPTAGNFVTAHKAFQCGVGNGVTKTFYPGVKTAVTPATKKLLLSKGLAY